MAKSAAVRGERHVCLPCSGCSSSQSSLPVISLLGSLDVGVQCDASSACLHGRSPCSIAIPVHPSHTISLTLTGNAAAGAGAGQYQAPTTTYWQQPPATTVYQQPATTTVYIAGGAAGNNGQYQTTAAAAAATTTVYQQPQNGGAVAYCSTLYEKGPNLPTTARGQCGTVLILPAEASLMVVGLREWAWAIGGVVTGVHVVVGRVMR